MDLQLPQLPELTFEEEWHSYKVNGITIPSVSKIMRPLSSQAYKDIDREVLDRAASRGTAVHFAIELYSDTGYAEIDEEYKPYFEAYLQWERDYRPQIIATEYRVYHPALWYAGTLDKIAVIKESNTLVDIKTTAVLSEWQVSVQLSAYEQAAKAHGINIQKKAVLHLTKAGYTYKEVDDSFDIFLACMKIQNFLKLKGVKI